MSLQAIEVEDDKEAAIISDSIKSAFNKITNSNVEKKLSNETSESGMEWNGYVWWRDLIDINLDDHLSSCSNIKSQIKFSSPAAF